jgi:hypothetical protein
MCVSFFYNDIDSSPPYYIDILKKYSQEYGLSMSTIFIISLVTLYHRYFFGIVLLLN